MIFLKTNARQALEPGSSTIRFLSRGADGIDAEMQADYNGFGFARQKIHLALPGDRCYNKKYSAAYKFSVKLETYFLERRGYHMNQGVVYAVLAYLLWGLLPLYWKFFQHVPAWEILAHRILWSFVFVGVILSATRRWRQLKESVTDRRQAVAVFLCSLLISVNWLTYIWAVNNDRVMETSLGYYMNPLISVLFGVLFLKEKLNSGQWMAIALAMVGVSILTIQYGHIPWVAILLALSFAFYGLAKKMVNADSMVSLAWETILVFPVSLLYLVFLHVNGTDAAFSLSGWMFLLLTLSGVATALPLYWFAQATKKLPLTTVGFIQYLSPTTSLLLAIFVFKESFTTMHFISFAFIWGALAVFTSASWKKKQAAGKMPDEIYAEQQAVK
jgi:chloramphenicol-sensitive protein RarD